MAKSDFPKIEASQITSESVWLERRSWLGRMGLAVAGVGAGALWPGLAAASLAADTPALPAKPNPAFSLPDKLTSEKDVSTYNNFYEFGTGKGDPARFGGKFRAEPWTLTVEGEVEQPRTFDLDQLRKLAPLEERIYRMRCVEAWSMVIPWIGYPLSALLAQVKPTSKAKYVQFITAMQPDAMPGLNQRIIDWPYSEGLRIDEAVHPLTLLVFGVYGKSLPVANGAPLRIAIPWKYGFKSGKSIVRIRLLQDQPSTSWVEIAPQEYGFYANVNPDVPHPRWSQATERRIGGGLFAPRQATLMFNGYAEQVASLYSGMDLRRNY